MAGVHREVLRSMFPVARSFHDKDPLDFFDYRCPCRATLLAVHRNTLVHSRRGVGSGSGESTLGHSK